MPIVDPQIIKVITTSNGQLIVLQAYLPGETFDRTVKRVLMHFPRHGMGEYLVGFEHSQGPYYIGEFYVNPSMLERVNRDWIRANVGVSVRDLPHRIACTGSMRPVIHCGDFVTYEPVLPDTPLAIGDIITFRLSDQDVDISKNCPYISDSWGLTSVSSITGTKSIYIIHRIIRKIQGSYPEAFRTSGDNNFFIDACSVKRPSIVLKVVDIEKDRYVQDAYGYSRAVREHQKLLEEYGNGLNLYYDMRDSYYAELAEYNRLNGGNTSLSLLQSMYQNLIQTELDINTLADRLNALPAEIDVAQKDIGLTISR